MKLRHCLFASLLIIAMMASCSSEEVFTEIDSAKKEKVEGKMDEKTILKLTQKLSNSFTSITRGADVMDYPDYYGGFFVDDNRDIVILVKQTNSSVLENMSARMGTDRFVLRSCDYSYNDLQALFKQLTEFWLDNANDAIFNSVSLLSFGINEMTNRIQVDLKDCSIDNIRKFKQMTFDSPMLSFVKANGPLEVTADIAPGSALSCNGFAASTGYRAMKSGKAGFLTAGHFAVVGDVIKIGSQEVGICRASQFSGNLDAAWCEATNGYQPSYTTAMGVALSTQTISTPGVGISVNMEGFKSALQLGKVMQTDINGTYTIDKNGVETQVKVTNLTKCSYPCQKGDSGGVVYTDDGAIAGLQSGGSDKITATQFSVSYFAPARYIQTGLDVYLY